MKEVFNDRIEWRNNNGWLHRLDEPAIEYFDGRREWWFDGQRHRVDGPAVEAADGTKYWFVNGILHRLDGPAIEFDGGDKKWLINGVYYESEEEWFNKLNLEHQISFLFKLGKI